MQWLSSYKMSRGGSGMRGVRKNAMFDYKPLARIVTRRLFARQQQLPTEPGEPGAEATGGQPAHLTPVASAPGSRQKQAHIKRTSPRVSPVGSIESQATA